MAMNPARRNAIVLVCATVLILLAAVPAAWAAAGGLDTSFGVGGVATGLFGSLEAAVLQADGKIVSVGFCNHDFCLTRHNVDGSLDTSFGVGGQVILDISTDFDEAHAVALQADGKIVVGGGCDLPPYYASDFCLVRFNTDGSLDVSFGAGGHVTTDFALGSDLFENFDTVFGVAIQTDGNIVAAGTCADYAVGIWRFCLARYNDNGSLDGTFGTGGKVTTLVRSSDDEAAALALQTDGKIVVAGACFLPSLDFCLARYNVDGSLDGSFGIGGKVGTDFGSGDRASAITLQADGKIVAAGRCFITSLSVAGFCLARYNADGSLDGSFGIGGRVTTAVGTDAQTSALTIQTDQKLVAAGFCYTTGYHFCLARYNADGSLDASFGIGGTVVTAISIQDQAKAVALQADEKIIVAGDCAGSFCLARYLGVETNQAPTDIALSSGTIAENSPVGTTIGSFSTVDPNAGDTFTYGLVAGPGSGDNASFTIAGNTLKTAAVFDFETSSSYSIRVRTADSGGLIFEKVFAVAVTNVNEAPVAVNDSAITSKGNSVILDVLANDSDPDGDTLSVIAVTLPSKGIATINAGMVTYAPKANYTGPDSFTYTISDGHGLTALATVSISVIAGNAPPRAVRDRVAILADTPVTIPVLANDSDPEGNPLTIVAVTQGANGTAVINAGGTLTYTPAPGITGHDSFTYTISDGKGGTDVGTVAVNVSKK